LDEILAGAGFGRKTGILIMKLNRLIEPCSELAMSDWVRRSALEDILKENYSQLNEDRLYRNMDRLYGKRGPSKLPRARRKGPSSRSGRASCFTI
jgi:hypothetical protein